MQDYCKNHNVKGNIVGNICDWVYRGLDLSNTTLVRKPQHMSDRTITLSCSDSWNHCFSNGSQLHMIQGHYLSHGESLPKMPFRGLKFFFALTGKMPGIVFAPFSRTDDNGSKCWPTDKWLQLLTILKDRYKVPIYLLCSSLDDCSAFKDQGYVILKDYEASWINSILSTAHLVITVDTGISHLCHLLSVATHVLIYPNASPAKFAENPLAKMIYGNPRNIGVEQVLHACAERYTS